MFKLNLELTTLLLLMVSFGHADDHQQVNTSNNQMQVIDILEGITDRIIALDSSLNDTQEELDLKPSRNELEFTIESNRIESETSFNSVLDIVLLPKIKNLLDQSTSQIATKLSGVNKGVTNKIIKLESALKTQEELVSKTSQDSLHSINLQLEIKAAFNKSTLETEVKLSEMAKDIKGISDKLAYAESVLKSFGEELASKPSLAEIKSLIESNLSKSGLSQKTNLINNLPEVKSTSQTSTPDHLKKFNCTDKNYQQLFEDSCYLFSSDKANWTDAQDICHQMGGNLVKITNDKEFNFLQSQITGNTWVGLSDQEVEGQFKWIVDGSVLAPDTAQDWWYKGEPNNGRGNEDCVHFWNNGGLNLLNDKSCTYSHKYICEMPAVAI